MTKHPSRKVMNFRHLVGRDTIGENELQQLSNKCRNKNATYSTKLGLILIKLGQLNTRRILIWRSVCHLNLVKYYANFIEIFDELMERYRFLFICSTDFLALRTQLSVYLWSVLLKIISFKV